MKKMEFTFDEISLLKEVIRSYKQKVEDNKDYPTYDFKQEQLRRVDDLLAKLKS